MDIHACSIYQDTQQQFASVIPFMTYGLEHNEKCIYIVDDQSVSDVVGAFEASGFPIQTYIVSKQMEFATKNDTYLINGVFNPEKTIQLIKTFRDASLNNGFAGFRGTGEMTWALEDSSNNDKLIYYESQLNTLIQENHIAIMCQYNEKKFPHHTLTDVIRTHPTLSIYSINYDNATFYTPPEYMCVSDQFSGSAYTEMVREITHS